ncbi:trifunctional serine/threonine-protein kinase/ATP-binding protein/sensor histidine kinase [Phormidium nigroviride]
MNAITHILGYRIIEQLYAGDRTIVYRALQESDRTPVVIKLLRNEYPNFNELVQFRNQYIIAKNFNLSTIIKPLSLKTYQNSYALVMEDFGGISLSTYLKSANTENKPSKPLPLEEFLNLALQLTDTIHYLYKNRVIHKDIKPANILINPNTKQIKLIDFSIASLLPRETQEIQNPNILEGTLAYISPEQTGRMNRGIDYRSDFYSLGVTFYELFAGQLPFVADDPMELVHCHLAKQPIPIHEINLEIPLLLSQIVSKLMAKNAENRYQTALGLKHDLEICLTQLQKTGKIPAFELGKRDITDRFLITEKLYGRETEVSQLLAAFERVSTGSLPETQFKKEALETSTIVKSDGEKSRLSGSELMLVAGFSGIGKTAVVNEVHKPIVRQRGYFIKGKYDQFQRNIPFLAFVQAFRDLMRQLLSESEANLQTWKTKILSTVGDNGQVLIEVIPELERIIGPQPPVPELSGSAAQNRFNLLMQKFVQVFTTAEHPLVMFLDDLQWADSASLKLLQLLMDDTGHLLVLGAYRDNEVSPIHPFMLTVDEIIKYGATVHTIALQALSQKDMNQLVADTLNCDIFLAQPLTELVSQKTKGNPFFATQFLKSLYDDKLISFDLPQSSTTLSSPLTKGEKRGVQGGWQCDIAQVKALALTDDVVEFMALQLQKLPRETQDALKLAACIGAQFDLETLAIVSQKSAAETATFLWKSLQEGFILPTTEIYKFFLQTDSLSISHSVGNPSYKFLHDRVQQAAYLLIPENQKQATHLQIGQLLLQNSSEIEHEEKLFDIVGHLNLGQELISLPRKREELAQLNLKAAQKARNSTAYAAARIYVQTGIELLTANCWETQYELTLNLYIAAAEIAYLNADFEGMEQMAAEVLQSAQTILDKVKIYEILIFAKSAQSKVLEAIAMGTKALEQLGVEFPATPDEALISKVLQSITNQKSGRKVEELVDLPVMTDAKTLAAMQLLATLFLPIFLGMPGLLPLLSCKMVSLSLQFGNTSASSTGYVVHGMVLCAFLGDVETGYDFGKLALSLLEKFNAIQVKSMILSIFGTLIQHQKEPLRATIATQKCGYTTGMETGDFLYAGMSLSSYSAAGFWSGTELNSLDSEMASYSTALAQMKQFSAQNYINIIRQTAQNLRETNIHPDCLSGSIYDEVLMIPQHHHNNDLTALAKVYIYKLFLAYFFGNYNAGNNYIAQANLYVRAVPAMVFVPIFHFYAALTRLAVFPQSEIEQAEILIQVENHQTTLYQCTQNSGMNHLHKWYLVEAEKQRVLGNKADAIENYERAIAGAKENKYLQEEAIANELTAKFYLGWGKEKVAQVYMIEAYYGYTRWGAKAKVEDLEKRYPELLVSILKQPQTSINLGNSMGKFSTQTVVSSGINISSSLDFATFLKASQALSSEIQLEQLLSTLMQVLMENAGADKCTLILVKGDSLTIEATALSKAKDTNNQNILLQSTPVESSQEIPVGVINYVFRTRETLVIDDKMVQILLASDSYFLQQQPQSLLCTPIINQGKLIGIIYLENHLTAGVFTCDRLQVIKLLTAQAAISLENAQLYSKLEEYSHNLEQKVEERTQEITQKATQLESTLEKLYSTQAQLIQAEKMSGLGQLVAGIAHEINNPINFIYGNLEPASEYITSLIELNNLYQQLYPQPLPEIEEKIADIELEFIVNDLHKLLSSMKLGADRIRQIVLSLRNFSRLDESEMKPVDIHSGIDSTLLILQHRLKNNSKHSEITIIQEYAQLPLVNCYASALNQVFMNIINNAIDALEESRTNHPPTIIIRTEIPDPEKILIRIKDNGVGISEPVRNKIFEPFFTTKAIGSGTGLGLSISYSIVVEKHGGQLTCNSTLGVGTEFAIALPQHSKIAPILKK